LILKVLHNDKHEIPLGSRRRSLKAGTVHLYALLKDTAAQTENTASRMDDVSKHKQIPEDFEFIINNPTIHTRTVLALNDPYGWFHCSVICQ
jgi:hypothetical protein